MNDEKLHLLALSLIPRLGRVRGLRLIRRLESAAAIFSLSGRDLTKLRLPSEARSLIRSGLARETAEQAIEAARPQQIQILSFFDPQYLQLLKEIFDPPLILYCRGEMDLLLRPSVAMVGSRRCSVYGKEMTQQLAGELVAVGLNVVSGLARGIDSQAHIGALQAGGTTVAVLGNGVDVVYPRENRRLYDQIRAQGCLVSEFPCGSFPAPQNFPVLNRIISGLCHGTVITEASEFSGSLITARLTLEQDREVWALPGNVTNGGSYGPNYLIKQGDHPVLTAQEVLDALPLHVLQTLRPPAVVPPPEPSETSSSGAGVMKLLKPDEPIHFDQLRQTSGLTVPELNGELLELEMKGLIQQWPGRRFSRRLRPRRVVPSG